ncbi:MAG: hypothetical protein JW940_20000, partial [Polyangiaceae bacterium]|nr:hypothetical protein [Polyangiaceae bacterium]
MDVAGFVGFAAAGPVDVPVLVEDAQRFSAIFGPDVALAWDPVRGEPVFGQLGSTVRAFFANGGRRCWVVRVARNPEMNHFLVSGLLAVREACAVQAALLEARSEGSWSDDVEVGATLSLDRLPPAGRCPASEEQNRRCLTFRRSPATPIREGDLLELRPADGQGTVLYFPVEKIEQPPFDASDEAATGAVLKVHGGLGYWFRAWTDEDFSTCASGSLGLLTAKWLDGTEATPVCIHEMVSAAVASPPSGSVHPRHDTFDIRVARSEGDRIAPGCWLSMKLPVGASPPALVTVLLLVQQGFGAEQAAPASGDEPGAAEESVWLRVRAWRMLDARPSWQTWECGQELQAAVARLELWARAWGSGPMKLDGLGFFRSHSRALHHLPSDRVLYARMSLPDAHRPLELWRDVDQRAARFALAAPQSADSPELGYLPLGVPAVLDDAWYQGAVGIRASQSPSEGAGAAAASRDPLVRQGLDQLDVDLFVDGRVAGESSRPVRVSQLLERAFAVSHPVAGSEQMLSGIHSLLGIDELSLLAVPDAAHLGWAHSGPDHEALAAPALSYNSGVLSWVPVPAAVQIIIERSSDPLFTTGVRALSLDASTGTTAAPRTTDDPPLLFYRVHLERLGRRGPSSNTVHGIVTPAAMVECSLEPIPSPVLGCTQTRGRSVLGWTLQSAGRYQCRLERSNDSAFLSARTLYEGPFDAGVEARHVAWNRPRGVGYYRVAVSHEGRQSPWSNVVVVGSETVAGNWQVIREAENEPSDTAPSPAEQRLLAIHAAMIRTCAARGDVFALLSLPLCYRERRARRYKEWLDSHFRLADEHRALSHAALFHPWLRLPTPDDDATRPFHVGPPDGAVAGLMAHRALEAGAWRSAANRPFAAVIGLEPTMGPSACGGMTASQINMVVDGPRGLTLSSDTTLSPDHELATIGVRRLLGLLRRLVLRHGPTYVFEGNSPSFRRRIQRQFERVLSDLQLRGALAGTTANEAFQVIADDSINPPTAIDSGRLTVEIRVAPAQPLKFLTLRLVQGQAGEIAAEEVG